MSESVGDKAAVAASLGNLGLVLQQQGDYSQAPEYLKKALSTYETVGVKSGEANALAALGQANFLLGSYQEALDYYGKSIMNQTGTVFQWNSKTGAYKLNACNGTTISGKGTVALVNSILTLTDFKSDRRIGVAFSTSQLTGRDTIYLLIAPGVWQLYTINDTTSHGQGCSCGFS